jgi:hypothetical protein
MHLDNETAGWVSLAHGFQRIKQFKRSGSLVSALPLTVGRSPTTHLAIASTSVGQAMTVSDDVPSNYAITLVSKCKQNHTYRSFSDLTRQASVLSQVLLRSNGAALCARQKRGYSDVLASPQAAVVTSVYAPF